MSRPSCWLSSYPKQEMYTINQEIVMFIVNLVATFLLSLWFGTMAAIKYEKKKEERERIAAIHSLLHQTRLVRQITESNTKQDRYYLHFTMFVKLPTQAFETAFVSNKPSLSKQPELINIVNDYISKAYFVNSGIDFLGRIEVTPISENSQVPQRVFSKIQEECKALFSILEHMENQLTVEISPPPLLKWWAFPKKFYNRRKYV